MLKACHGEKRCWLTSVRIFRLKDSLAEGEGPWGKFCDGGRCHWSLHWRRKLCRNSYLESFVAVKGILGSSCAFNLRQTWSLDWPRKLKRMQLRRRGHREDQRLSMLKMRKAGETARASATPPGLTTILIMLPEKEDSDYPGSKRQNATQEERKRQSRSERRKMLRRMAETGLNTASCCSSDSRTGGRRPVLSTDFVLDRVWEKVILSSL